MKSLCHWILKVMGWKIIGSVPDHIKKMMVLFAPHTSNWDAPLIILIKTALGYKISFLAKDTLFVWPLSSIIKSWGGIPLDRSPGNNAVAEAIELINQKEEIIFCLSPEGHRKKVEKLKTGFYRIAKATNIPLILVKLDFKHKKIVFGEPYSLHKSMEEDIAYVSDYFRGVIGIVAENSFL